MKVRAISIATVALALGITAWSCGGDSSKPPTSPTPSPNPNPAPATVTITITNAGVSPSAVDVAVGGTVTFTNNASDAHDMDSNPHPVHTDCPALNVGVLRPGESRASQALSAARSCGFHDHNNPGTGSLMGTITIR
jgi:plastocyanin